MAVTGVFGDTGVAGGGASGTVTLTLAEPLPPNLQLPGNPTLATTPSTTLPATSNRIANVAYVRDAISTYGGGSGPDGNFLPLTGGQLSGALQINYTGGTSFSALGVVSSGDQNGINISHSTSGIGSAIAITNNGTPVALYINQHAESPAIWIENRGIHIYNKQYGHGILLNNEDLAANALQINNLSANANGINVIHGEYAVGSAVAISNYSSRAGLWVHTLGTGHGFYIDHLASSGNPAMRINNHSEWPGIRIVGGSTNFIELSDEVGLAFAIGARGHITLSPEGIQSLKEQLGLGT